MMKCMKYTIIFIHVFSEQELQVVQNQEKLFINQQMEIQRNYYKILLNILFTMTKKEKENNIIY